LIDSQLHTELWTSWASLLRSYAAAHGLNSTQHAVVEVSAEEITLRVGSRWLRFTPNEVTASNHPPVCFRLNEDGTATIGNQPQQEMDIAAEQFAREILTPSSDSAS
jgi:head-tail adaptor